MPPLPRWLLISLGLLILLAVLALLGVRASIRVYFTGTAAPVYHLTR